MPDPSIKANDLAVLHIPPASNVDARVPTAEELSANSQIMLRNLQRAASRPAGVRNRPSFTSPSGLSVTLPGSTALHFPHHPGLTSLGSNVTFTLPGLGNTVDSISRYDHVQLVAMGLEVRADIDPDINFSFRWRRQDAQIQTLVKENTRRLRTYWAVVVSPSTPITAAAIATALPTLDGVKTLEVDTVSTGIPLGSFQIFLLDPTLVDEKSYRVYTDTIEVVDLCRVWRVQNFTQKGYLWGNGGEGSLISDIHIQPTYRYVGVGAEDYEMRGQDSLQRLITGRPLLGGPGMDRAVVNLVNGQVAENVTAPGIPAASPNGSVALANGQRITFTNEARTERRYCVRLQSTNVGGVAEVVAPFAVSSPLGSTVAPNPADHKIYDEDGNEISNEGVFSGLGDTGALVWRCSSSAVLTPGDYVYVQMGIYYPPGSGFVFSGRTEQVYLDGVALNAANVREASEDDFGEYTAPAADGNYIAVMGRERAALHYLYRKYTVSSTAGGILRMPTGATGVIAFVSGSNAPTGRQDKPVLTGLDPSASYTVLCYYAPPSSDKWQFQIKHPRYPAVDNGVSTLNGSRVVTPLFLSGHTQGGGTSVYQSDGRIRYEAVGMRLPYNSTPGAKRPHVANAKLAFSNQPDPGPAAFRDLDLLSGRGLALLRPGIPVAAASAGDAQDQGLAAVLTSDGIPLGVQKLPLASRLPYQLVGSCVVEKGGLYYLLVVTAMEGDPKAISYIPLSAATPAFAGIGLFPLW
jgi:hypothetical protein